MFHPAVAERSLFRAEGVSHVELTGRRAAVASLPQDQYKSRTPPDTSMILSGRKNLARIGKEAGLFQKSWREDRRFKGLPSNIAPASTGQQCVSV
jgi:hypothetical protein